MEQSTNVAQPQGAVVATDVSAEQLVQQAQQAEKPAEQQDDRFASKFAALSRKEKQIRQREMEINQRLQEIKNRAKQAEEEYGKWRSVPDRLKNEPLKVLEEAGLSFEQLAEMALNDGKPTFDMQQAELEKRMSSKLAELEKKLQEKEENEKAQRQEAILSEFKNGLQAYIEENASTYELVKANDAFDLVFDVIETQAERTGEVMDYKDACEAVETYLLEEAKKHLSLSKIKALLGNQGTEKESKQEERSSVTLSNELSAQPVSESGRRLSDEESKRLAAKMIRWED